ncbi:MAG: 2-dehydropantoate 2-reductase [Betaproteobacteria bacterium]|nr:MAG: 2-dehydropantoate 2-reductase [Betaproteobacteria bacterium]
MKICIVGAGAVGGLIGARLAHAGVDVSAVARNATAAALREHGWRLQIGGQTITAPVRAVRQASELEPQDYVVIAVKGPAMAGVAPIVRTLVHPETTIVTAMNGVPWWFFHGLPGAFEGLPLATIDPDGVIAAAVPVERVIGAVVHLTCSTLEPGVVRHGVGNRLIVGEPKGGSSARLLAFAELLREAAFEVEVSPRIQQDIWYKLWGNMTMNPISAFTGALADRILDDPLVNQFCLDVMAEAAAIGAAIGCPVAQSGADRMAVTRKLGAFKTSMLQDVEAGKAVEIDALLSAPREIGARAGVPTPYLDTLLGLARLHARVHGLYPESATR